MEKELLELLTIENYEEAAAIANKLTPEELSKVLKETDEKHLAAFTVSIRMSCSTTPIRSMMLIRWHTNSVTPCALW